MANPMHVPEITIKDDDGVQATFVIEPLHRGFGITLGNSLRRVLLSSLEGSAVTGFKANGVSHEFSTIPGVIEDVVQITLNLKQIRFRMFTDEPQMLTISKKGKGTVTAKDIEANGDVEIITPDAHIATLDNAKSTFNFTLRVEKGRGYLPVEEQKKASEDVNMISIDSLFSPVQRVRYRVENTRVGQVTDLDKLVIDVTTDGSVSPSDAMKESATILVQHFAVITGESPVNIVNDGVEATDGSEPAEPTFGIEDLNLSPRTTNALTNNKISTVRDLVDLSDNDLKTLKGFGAKAYHEVVDKLKELELR